MLWRSLKGMGWFLSMDLSLAGLHRWEDPSSQLRLSTFWTWKACHAIIIDAARSHSFGVLVGCNYFFQTRYYTDSYLVGKVPPYLSIPSLMDSFTYFGSFLLLCLFLLFCLIIFLFCFSVCLLRFWFCFILWVVCVCLFVCLFGCFNFWFLSKWVGCLLCVFGRFLWLCWLCCFFFVVLLFFPGLFWLFVIHLACSIGLTTVLYRWCLMHVKFQPGN